MVTNTNGSAVTIPDSFTKNKMASGFNTLADTNSLSDGIVQSFGIISFKGKTWTLKYQGKANSFVRTDDGTPSPYIDVVILDAGKGKSKSYFPSYDQDAESSRPICASIDGIVPDADVKEQQSETCALCPRNKWQMQANGRMGRDCTDYKRLAVLVLPAMTKPMLGYELMEPVFLRVPPASLKALASMGDAMDRAGHKYFSYITRIGFEPTKSYPQLTFKPVQSLSDKEAPTILELRQDPIVNRIIGGDVSTAVDMVLQPAGTVVTGIAQATPAPAPLTMTNGGNPTAPVPAPAGNEPGNDDLDKRIAALLAK